LAALLACSTVTFGQATSRPAESQRETKAEKDARMAWFREARFGMFIHWGLYSVPGGEWGGEKDYGEWLMEEAHVPASEYEKLIGKFNPVKFDANAWVKTAKDAGASYIVITTKHHDGFAMFPTKMTSYGLQSTPFGKAGRDPMKELAQACREQGIRLCFYHSIMDWHSPDYEPRRKWNDTATGTPDMDRYEAYLKGELKEILSNYGPIGILWFDGEWEGSWNGVRGQRIYDYVRSLQPDIIVNNRVGKARDANGQELGDYGTPEQHIPATGFGPGVDWESCMTLNGHWGYNKADSHWKSSVQLVRNLIECSSKGGNFLLNVGPTGEGEIPAASVERMEEIGHWMDRNAESIRGTTASPFAKLRWGRATTKGKTLYLQVYDWPADGVLHVPMRGKIEKAELLAAPGTVATVGSDEAGATLTFPTGLTADPASTVVKVSVDGDVLPITLLPGQDASGTLRLEADDAVLGSGPAQLERINGAATIGYWTDTASAPTWTAQLDRPGTFIVELRLAADKGSGGSTFELSCGDQTLTGTVPDTGSWDKFVTLNIGSMTLKTPGKATFKLTPKTKPGLAVMNLQSVVLRPG
jgi:alpha-L-fucosidase